MKNKICETMFWKLSSAIHSNNYYLFHHLEDVIDGTMLLMIFYFLYYLYFSCWTTVMMSTMGMSCFGLLGNF